MSEKKKAYMRLMPTKDCVVYVVWKYEQSNTITRGQPKQRKVLFIGMLDGTLDAIDELDRILGESNTELYLDDESADLELSECVVAEVAELVSHE